MIKTIAEFNVQYHLICEPAAKALENATIQYEDTLKNFIIKNFCNEDEFQKWKENIWLDSNLIFDSSRNYITESMILNFMISEVENYLHCQSDQFSQDQNLGLLKESIYAK